MEVLDAIKLLLPVGRVVEVGEERVRKEVVVHTVKVDAQHLQDLSRYFKNKLLVKQIGQG